jgi:hypothetical protein
MHFCAESTERMRVACAQKGLPQDGNGFTLYKHLQDYQTDFLAFSVRETKKLEHLEGKILKRAVKRNFELYRRGKRSNNFVRLDKELSSADCRALEVSYFELTHKASGKPQHVYVRLDELSSVERASAYASNRLRKLEGNSSGEMAIAALCTQFDPLAKCTSFADMCNCLSDQLHTETDEEDDDEHDEHDEQDEEGAEQVAIP